MSMKKTLQDFLTEARSRVKGILPDDLMAMMEAGEDFLLVDVREESEYARGYIEGALLVPRGILEGAADHRCPNRENALCNSRERKVVVYCHSGGRSAMAADTLQQMGFKQVFNLEGGIVNWEAEDYPVEHLAGAECVVPGLDLG